MYNEKIVINYLKESDKKSLLTNGCIFIVLTFNLNLFNINLKIKNFILGVLFFSFIKSIFFYIKKYKKYTEDIKTKILEIENELESLSIKINELKYYRNYLNHIDEIYNIQEAKNFYYIKVKKQKNRCSLNTLISISCNLSRVVLDYYDLAVKMNKEIMQENQSKYSSNSKSSYKSYSNLYNNSNMSKKDKCLKILGLGSDFNLNTLKKSYRTLVKKYHPDCVTGDSNKFREVTEAYNYLKAIS